LNAPPAPRFPQGHRDRNRPRSGARGRSEPFLSFPSPPLKGKVEPI
jgi:hypothetical protein